MSEKYAMQSWPLRRYDFPMPVRYHLSGPAEGGLVICLHGYQDHALSLLRRLGWWEKTDLPFRVLAINGPFPVPLWLQTGFVEAYSWYFRDVERDLEFVSPQTTAERLGLLLTDLGLFATPKVLFGFSMGGYLAPHLAARVEGVRAVIGYGCGYVPEVYAQKKDYAVHAIHGDRDERVEITAAHAGFNAVIADGRRGEFHLIPDLPHKVQPSVEPLIRRLCEENLR